MAAPPIFVRGAILARLEALVRQLNSVSCAQTHPAFHERTKLDWWSKRGDARTRVRCR
jgi:hypothetical protein